jgi:predicted Zn-dependent peptidase
MGLIGGNSYGFAYARARDGVAVEEVEDALLAEVDTLLQDGPTEVELRRGKAQYERHWLHELAAIDSRADALGEHATLLGDPELINTRLSEVNAIEMDAVAAAAAGWFGRDRLGTLIYRKDQP